MSDLSQTSRAFIKRLIQRYAGLPRVGRVTDVYEHTEADDNSNFEFDVRLRSDSQHYRRIPILQPFSGIDVPEVGDDVVVIFIDGNEPVIAGRVATATNRPELGQEHIYRLNKGNLYTEMHPDGDWVRIAKKGADDGAPSVEIEIDDSGSNAVINIKTNGGDINVNPNGGDVLLDGGGNRVATVGDSVSVEDNEGGTLTGSITSGSDNVKAP